MTYRGTVQNGVVVFVGDEKPPEGISVEVYARQLSSQDAEECPTDRKIFDVERYAVDTGIPDLALNHDHYLYGLPKVNDGE